MKYVIILLAFILLAILGYGFNNAYNVRKTARQIGAIMSESNNIWTIDKFQSSTMTVEQIKSAMIEINNDSINQLIKLDSLKGYGRANDILKKTKKYFTIAKNASDKIVIFVNYSKILDEANTLLQAINLNEPDNQKLVANIEKYHEQTSTIIKELKEDDVPDTYKSFNTQYLVILERLDKLLVEAIGFAKNNQIDKLNSLNNDWDAINQGIKSLKLPSEQIIKQELLSENDADILRTYPVEIQNEAKELDKVIICY